MKLILLSNLSSGDNVQEEQPTFYYIARVQCGRMNLFGDETENRRLHAVSREISALIIC